MRRRNGEGFERYDGGKRKDMRREKKEQYVKMDDSISKVLLGLI